MLGKECPPAYYNVIENPLTLVHNSVLIVPHYFKFRIETIKMQMTRKLLLSCLKVL